MALFVANYSVYGRRKLTKAAHRAGIDVGRDQVARLMAREGIRGATRARKRFTTRSDPAAVRAPDLLKRDFTASRPNQKRFQVLRMRDGQVVEIQDYDQRRAALKGTCQRKALTRFLIVADIPAAMTERGSWRPARSSSAGAE